MSTNQNNDHSYHIEDILIFLFTGLYSIGYVFTFVVLFDAYFTSLTHAGNPPLLSLLLALALVGVEAYLIYVLFKHTKNNGKPFWPAVPIWAIVAGASTAMLLYTGKHFLPTTINYPFAVPYVDLLWPDATPTVVTSLSFLTFAARVLMLWCYLKIAQVMWLFKHPQEMKFPL